MEPVIRIATQVGTPLALSGLIAALFFFVVLRVLNPSFVPQLTATHGSKLLRSIITAFFVLSLVALVLGFAGWIVSKTLSTKSALSEKRVMQNAMITVSATNNGVIIGNLSTDNMTQAVVQVFQNYGIPTEKYEVVVREHAITVSAVDRFLEQIGETDNFAADVDSKLGHVVRRFEEMAATMKAAENTNATQIGKIQDGISTLRRGDLKTAGALLDLRPPAPTGFRVVSGQ